MDSWIPIEAGIAAPARAPPPRPRASYAACVIVSRTQYISCAAYGIQHAAPHAMPCRELAYWFTASLNNIACMLDSTVPFS
eukprot:6201426-Pleurochrysis_carterae.AAC.1